MIELIKMRREESQGQWRDADVHPAEVENFRRAGYALAELPAPAETPTGDDSAPAVEAPKLKPKKK